MTLLALALAVGIVIDDAIVVLENIYRSSTRRRWWPFPAAIHATKEIRLAVLATTLSLMAVFLPVAFMSGIVGRFLFSFGMTMAFAIGVSMIVAFTLTPMMASRMLPLPLPGDRAPQSRGSKRGSDFCTGRSAALLPRPRVLPAGAGSSASRSSARSGRSSRWQKVGGFLPPNDEAAVRGLHPDAEGTTLRATRLIARRQLARKVQRQIPSRRRPW
jgi:multidrug efflux pump subunit AcrB